MSYQVLARKWRPKSFGAGLVGQEHVVRALSHALSSGRLHHAYLFTGTRGVGKTTLSRILAKALNCTGADGKGGVTAEPCGVCESCRAIDAGRFIDYVEMDAASNRGVDEMTTLLERAVYAPTAGRYKVYMIDEVHMLTNHAFNAMLKTLEEPPEHMKFILATTDPQKIPVTVLSRCLQFNLKQMPAGATAEHLARILTEESIQAEPQALALIARAAHGSMRDALSLTDQAIAYCAGPITAAAVREMLGAVDTGHLIALLDALAARDPARLGEALEAMSARSIGFEGALSDLAALLHRIALAQAIPDSVHDDLADRSELLRLAQAFPADEVQLLYGIAIKGLQELSWAPDPGTGFSMTLLRMLAFAPVAAGSDSASRPLLAPRPGSRISVPVAAPKPRQDLAAPVCPPEEPSRVSLPPTRILTAAAAPVDSVPPLLQADAAAAGEQPTISDWPAVAARLRLTGIAQQLALQSALVSDDGGTLTLSVAARGLSSPMNNARLQQALAAAGYVRRIEVRLDEQAPMPAAADAPVTAHQRMELERTLARQALEDAVQNDAVVLEIKDLFGATVVPASIRAAESDRPA
ncbi:MAG TPA: DNA polymerase III subunit gamma/tau [Burkholderiaceae bacterium]|nr:DNA polymerase III subunit gamma/tau [Burkholderiaceae bacterium]